MRNILISLVFLLLRLPLCYMCIERGGMLGYLIVVGELLTIVFGGWNICKASKRDGSASGLWVPAGYLIGMMVVPSGQASLWCALIQAGLVGMMVAVKLNFGGSMSLGPPTFLRLVDGGVYSVIRHPMYAIALSSRILGLVAWPTAWNAAVVCAYVVACVASIRSEETFLDAHGYAAYRARVRWRLVPAVW